MFVSDAAWENHEKYEERLRLYRSFGYDMEKERRFVLEKLGSLSGRILEVGTGKGYFSIALARMGLRFTSLDVSKVEQEFARLNISYFGLESLVDFTLGDAGQLPYARASYDVIISVNVVHHLARPFKAADEMARVVVDMGKIVLSDFSPEGQSVIEKVHAHEGRKHEMGAYGLQDMKKYFEEKNFRVEEQRSEHQEMIIAYRSPYTHAKK
ncbi:MAG: hypothetical protein A2268_14735 [Candidatus Raymondbacteria bacterium RifOxyA12_full_50_37]|uniref:Methyltransferase type 11 domain-containing protein n=1 Tax=Candidatus Raymondbacteria bacterium RIFOXYD12_FULL_49_13 TaxID=1817890 RepID=A0A1F7F2T4_UNCRA|nr:MAG: hypothetical protein A2268_14735 [Candidatus Raymondbacteria bacterium RifOxyA12_full_50_37]OGJ87821.1 MAG: hypothetical protein A2350_12680 [Candidatus Raymondbacteria bacterium RifOxyB12_full_50_8]OGJ88675.1 MAG: hypothetical protein A2248_20670 [Candidatus Raymondbacteria bacterium RIFOXYA2_FULL_49_16]OGJ95969.1 MAG: hypothetical protein A2487_21065 [Candidatus Raymondbacteria bacterium RifOxyC12_full_50_8]OGK00847.1 MAG: hypothetical protein A2519_07925 [Candidatus Raymondbacteria b